MPLPKQLNIEKFPNEAAYLWEWWAQMRECNGEDFSAVQVQAWFTLNGISPEPWEVQAIMGIWRELLKSRNEAAN